MIVFDRRTGHELARLPIFASSIFINGDILLGKRGLNSSGLPAATRQSERTVLSCFGTHKWASARREHKQFI